MRLSLSLASFLLLAACTDSGTHLTPGAAFAEAHTAMRARDASRAVVHLRAAAQQGHLDAVALLADAYAQGRLSPSGGYQEWERQGGAIVLPITVLPGQAGRWERRFEELLADSLTSNNPDAMLMQASRLLHQHPNEPTLAEREEALALLTTLAEADHANAALSLAVQLRHTDPHAAQRWLAVAIEQGHPQACYFLTWFSDDESVDFHSAERVERYLDTLADCPTPLEEQQHVRTQLDALRAEAEEGNAAAQTLLDSLETSGLFARHPALANTADA